MPGTKLGEILVDARIALAGVESAAPSHGLGLAAATAQLGRVTGALSSYLPGITAVREAQPWSEAAGELAYALQRATERLTGGAIPDASVTEPGSQAWHLSQAADILTTGHELLRTHFTTTPAMRADRSRWARVIGSPQVTAALVDEIGDQARQAAEVAEQLAARSRDNGTTCDPAVLAALRTAGHWLRQCGQVPGTRTELADPALLDAVQSASIQGRITPRLGEPHDVFLAGVEASAQRLTHISAHLPGKAQTSPAISADAWQSAAKCAGTVCGVSEVLLRDLTWPERPRRLALPVGVLSKASFRARLACLAWRHVSSAWQTFRTDSLQATTPATSETSDLVTRLNWLAFDAPSPGAAISMNPRDVVSALHQAADSLAYMAAGDLEAIAAACQAGRVYELGASAPAKSGRQLGQITQAGLTEAEPLRAAYVRALEATEALAHELDSIAVLGGTRSALLARIRSAAPLECDVTWHSNRDPAIQLAIPGRGGHAPGPVENRLRTMGVSDPSLLQEAGTLDRAAEQLLGHAERAMPDTPATGKSGTRRETATPPRTHNRSGHRGAGRGD